MGVSTLTRITVGNTVERGNGGDTLLTQVTLVTGVTLLTGMNWVKRVAWVTRT